MNRPEPSRTGFEDTQPGYDKPQSGVAPSSAAPAAVSAPPSRYHLMWQAALWAFSLYAVYSMFRAHLALPAWQPWFMLAPVLLLVNPWIRARCGRWVLPPAAALVVAFILNAIGVALFKDVSRWEQAKADEARLAASLQKRDELREQALSEFNADKLAVLRRIAGMLEAGKPKDAFSEAGRYLAVTKDPDLARLHTQAEVAVMKLELENEEALPLERREQIYRTLMQEEPQTAAQFQGRMVAVTNALASKRRIEKLQASAPGQFAGPGGPHKVLELYVKGRLKDPGSYQHVRTDYGIGDEGISIEMTFRAKNSFGAVVTQRVYARADENADISFVSDF